MRFPLTKECYRCAWHAKGGRFLCRWPFGLWDVSAAEEAVRGRPGRRLVLLEGMHRAVRCLRERRDFRAYVLPARETAAVELKAGRRAKAGKNFGAGRPAVLPPQAPRASCARPVLTRRTRAA